MPSECAHDISIRVNYDFRIDLYLDLVSLSTSTYSVYGPTISQITVR